MCFHLELFKVFEGKTEYFGQKPFYFPMVVLKTFLGPMYDFYVLKEYDLAFFPSSF